MPKQVRLRRGTTAQHATFTGAEGEVTFDTTKKCLVLHDGVTAGGQPVDGFVRLDPGAPLSSQEVRTCLAVTGGDSDTDSFSVVHPARFASQVIVDSDLVGRRVQVQQESLLYAPTLNVDFATFGLKRIDLTGDLSLTATNMMNGRSVMVRLKSDSAAHALSFPPAWRWLGSAAPTALAADKLALLWLWCFGPGESDVMARYLVES
ncbi:MAG: hypothetical protein HZA90_26340 [Verrucomicrobia bacterium]|nr:hypothetical protein [Verrucomicrobiota bacterium]